MNSTVSAKGPQKLHQASSHALRDYWLHVGDCKCLVASNAAHSTSSCVWRAVSNKIQQRF